MAIGLLTLFRRDYTIGADPALDEITGVYAGGGGMERSSFWSYRASRTRSGGYTLEKMWWDEDAGEQKDVTVEIPKHAYEKILGSVNGLRYVKKKASGDVMDGGSESAAVFWSGSPKGSWQIEFTGGSWSELLYAFSEAWGANSYRANGPAELDGIGFFSFGYGPDEYMDGRETFSAELDGETGKVTLSYKASGQSEDDALREEADQSFMEELAAIMRKHGADRWNGFSGNDSWVMDGSSFGLTVLAGGDIAVSASGRESWPEGFHDFRRDIRELFLPYFPEME